MHASSHLTRGAIAGITLGTLVALVVTLAIVAGILSSVSPSGSLFPQHKVEELIDVTHRGVALTEKYLRAHPHATDLEEHINGGFPIDDYTNGNVRYAPAHDDWDDWYITATYLDQYEGGAYYYNSHTRQYYVCGGDTYLDQDWHVPPANISSTCPPATAAAVDPTAIAQP